MTSMLVLNGPNLNLLGQREPEIYGSANLEVIERRCRKHADSLGVQVEFLQSNHEGQLVDLIQAAPKAHQGLILNAAGYSHTSVALVDAIKAIDIRLSRSTCRTSTAVNRSASTPTSRRLPSG